MHNFDWYYHVEKIATVMPIKQTRVKEKIGTYVLSIFYYIGE